MARIRRQDTQGSWIEGETEKLGLFDRCRSVDPREPRGSAWGVVPKMPREVRDSFLYASTSHGEEVYASPVPVYPEQAQHLTILVEQFLKDRPRGLHATQSRNVGDYRWEACLLRVVGSRQEV